MGPRAARRRPGPPEHQGRVARVREDRDSDRASGFSATSRSDATSSTPSSSGLYDAVVYAVGAQTDRRLGIPGEDLPGSWPATEFVAWYNGHPDFQDSPSTSSCERAVVSATATSRSTSPGCSRSPRARLAPDRHDRRGDRGDPRLADRGDRHARPPRPGAGVVHDPGAQGARRARRRRRRRRSGRARARRGRAKPLSPRPTVARNLEVLREYAARPPAGKRRTLRLRFSRLAGRDPRRRTGSRRSRSSATSWSPTRRARARGPDGRARGDPVRHRPAQRRLPRRRPSRACRSTRQRATMRNRGGRVLDADGAQVAGVYCAGWIKRGPTGVIGTNKKDATETVELLLEDVRGGSAARGRARSPTASTRCSPSAASRSSTYAGWEAIDAVERARGEPQGRPRVKLLTLGRAPRRLRCPRRDHLDRTVGRLGGHDGDGRAAGALGRGDPQGDRQLPGLRRADPRLGRPLARPHQGRGRARERRARPARRREGRADRRAPPTASPRASSTTSSRSTSSRPARARRRT